MNDVENQLTEKLSTLRIQNLVDGVFATAMTFLILNLHLSSAASFAAFLTSIQSTWPQFFSYFLSMLVLGAFWIGHHNQSHWIQHADRLYLWINIFFVSFIVLIPFTTTMVRSSYQEPYAVCIYGLNLIICGLILLWHWTHASSKHRLVDPGLSDTVIKTMRGRVLLPLGLSVFVLCIAVLSPLLGLFLYAGIFILGVFPTMTDALAKKLQII